MGSLRQCRFPPSYGKLGPRTFVYPPAPHCAISGDLDVNASGSALFGKPVVGLSAGVAFVLGLALTLFAVFADDLDLAIGGGEGFGYVQMIGLILGIVLMLIGAAVPL